MYRQINIQKEQRNFQRILWRPASTEPIRHYILNIVTYGTASAPYLATRCLRQVGEDNRAKYPVASRVIIRDFYVDDLLTGVNTVEEARTLKAELTELLSSAGFELRKWASNALLALVPHDDIAQDTNKMIQSDKDPKTLGLRWITKADQLAYSVKLSTHRKMTKRTILSVIAQIFDPLGLIGPATIRAKIILQKLWQLQLDWDESLPQDLHAAWTKFERELHNLNDVTIPRFVLCENVTSVELHGFCDASEAAYGACIYLRSLDKHGQIRVNLLCAKSRVAPLKRISLPRLELCGALLLARLTQKVRTALDLQIDEQHFWSDSKITLAWIKASPSRWETFVANRTTKIQELTLVLRAGYELNCEHLM